MVARPRRLDPIAAASDVATTITLLRTFRSGLSRNSLRARSPTSAHHIHIGAAVVSPSLARPTPLPENTPIHCPLPQVKSRQWPVSPMPAARESSRLSGGRLTSPIERKHAPPAGRVRQSDCPVRRYTTHNTFIRASIRGRFARDRIARPVPTTVSSGSKSTARCEAR